MISEQARAVEALLFASEAPLASEEISRVLGYLGTYPPT